MRGSLPIILGLVLLAPLPCLAQRNGYRPEVGKPHPDFVLPRIGSREPISLSQFRGKKVLLIHFASW